MAFVQVLFLAEEIDMWVISNHRPPTTITPPPDKPNRSEIHEQSNTFSTNISILFENLTRKLERSKRFGFEKNKVLLWMMVIQICWCFWWSDVGWWGAVRCPTWCRSGDGFFRDRRSRRRRLTVLACLVVVAAKVFEFCFILFYLVVKIKIISHNGSI